VSLARCGEGGKEGMRKQKTLKNHTNRHAQTEGKSLLETDGDSLD
jgi:hypothetical protein